MNNLIRKKQYTIKGEEKEVQIYLLNASEGLVVGTELLKVILPVLGGFADEMFTEEREGEVPTTFSEMAQRIIVQMGNLNILKLVKGLLKDASVNRQAIDFDDYFRGNYGELIIVLEFALRENFSSFFEETGLKTRLFQAMGAMTGEQAESDEQ